MPRMLTIPLIAAALALPAAAGFAATKSKAPATIPLLSPGTDAAAQGIPPQEPPGSSPTVAAQIISAAKTATS